MFLFKRWIFYKVVSKKISNTFVFMKLPGLSVETPTQYRRCAHHHYTVPSLLFTSVIFHESAVCMVILFSQSWQDCFWKFLQDIEVVGISQFYFHKVCKNYVPWIKDCVQYCHKWLMTQIFLKCHSMIMYIVNCTSRICDWEIHLMGNIIGGNSKFDLLFPLNLNSPSFVYHQMLLMEY